jgi:hypothetical protein
MPRFVDGLRRGVEFGIGIRHLCHDLRGTNQRALFALHEL